MTKADQSGDLAAVQKPVGPPRLPRGIPFFATIAVAVVRLLSGGIGGSFQGKLSEVQKNDNSSYLPASAESTLASNEAATFSTSQSLPGFLVFERDSGLTAEDKTAIAAARDKAATVKGVDTQALTPVTYSADGTAAAIYAPMIAAPASCGVWR